MNVQLQPSDLFFGLSDAPAFNESQVVEALYLTAHRDAEAIPRGVDPGAFCDSLLQAPGFILTCRYESWHLNYLALVFTAYFADHPACGIRNCRKLARVFRERWRNTQSPAPEAIAFDPELIRELMRWLTEGVEPEYRDAMTGDQWRRSWPDSVKQKVQ